MSYSGEDRRKSSIEINERLGVVEHRVLTLEDQVKESNKLLAEIKEVNIKLKTLVGAISIVISGLWLVVSTFKDTIVHFLTGK